MLWLKRTLSIVLTLNLIACATMTSGTSTRVTNDSGLNINEVAAQAYDGPQARISVIRFGDKSSNANHWYNSEIGDGMADMLTTALVNTGRFIVLERQAINDVLQEQDLGASGRVKAETAAAIGEIEGAEILVVANVTEFESNAGGTQAGGGGFASGILGAITGGSRSAHMAIDLRLIDARTSRVLAATSVEGEAKDFNLGGAIAGYTGTVGLGGALSTWKNTPREKALRQVIGTAVNYVVSKTPKNYYRHGDIVQESTRGLDDSSTATAVAASDGEKVVITASSLNVRSGPNVSNNAAFSLSSGTVVDVVNRTEGWLQIVDQGGRSGWVAEQFTLALSAN